MAREVWEIPAREQASPSLTSTARWKFQVLVCKPDCVCVLALLSLCLKTSLNYVRVASVEA
jgi:hypothetical protein